MKLSIVIPAKNEEQLLPVLLETLGKQEFKDFEVIVADAGSADHTRELAAQFGARVVPGGMPGPGRNRGAEASTGDLILFLDSDVVLASTKYLGEVIAEFEKLGADVATCRLEPISDRLDDQFGHEVYNHFAKLTESVRPHAPGSCILVKREVHQALNGFDESVVFAEDMDYVQRAHKQGFKFRVLKSHPVLISVRRLEKDGRLALVVKYIYGELRMLVKGPFRHMPYQYEMGGEDPSKK